MTCTHWITSYQDARGRERRYVTRSRTARHDAIRSAFGGWTWFGDPDPLMPAARSVYTVESPVPAVLAAVLWLCAWVGA